MALTIYNTLEPEVLSFLYFFVFINTCKTLTNENTKTLIV